MLRSNPVNPDSRVEKECSSLANNGYDVMVLCWDRQSTHPIEEGMLADGKTRVFRIGAKASFGEGFKNLRAYLSFQFKMRKWLKKHRNEFQAIHACDFDTAFFSYGIAKRYKKKFIFDIFDFICGDGSTFFKRRVKNAQIKLINNADATIICTEDRRKQIIQANPKALYVIHNSPNGSIIDNCGESATKNEYDINVVYVGILSNNRLLLEEAEVFKKHPTWHFVVGGFGLHEEFFKETSAKYPNIEFIGKTDYKTTLLTEKSADVLLAIYDPSIENHIYAAPNKFYESLMLGKPVIMVENTGMAENVAKYNIGELIDYTSEGFEQAIINLIARKQEWPLISDKMKKLYSTDYDWSIMEARLLDLYFNIFRR